MKKVLCVIFAIVIMFGSFFVAPEEIISVIAVKASAADVNDLIFAYDSKKQTYTLMGCSDSASGDIIIPATYNGKPVTVINSYAFENRKNITSIVVPEGVKIIYDSAFRNCEDLVSVVIPDSVHTIGREAFSGCKNLKNVKLPKNLKVIEPDVFGGCSSLVSLEFPAGLKKISAWSFAYCSSLETVIIPEGVTEIERAFTNCVNIKTVELPKSLRKLHGDNFIGSVLYNDKSNWDDCAFYIDTVLVCTKYLSEEGANPESYSVRPGTTLIADGAFYGYNNLKNIEFPDSLTSIGENCFVNCANLASVKFPASLERIGEYSFGGCNSLTSVTIPGKVSTLERYIFEECSNLKSVTILEGTKKIDMVAFDSCQNLSEVSLPDSLTDIWGVPFPGSKVFENKNYWYDGAFYLSNHLVYVPNDYVGIFAIKDGTVSIASCVFSNSYYLSGLIIPKSLKVINDSVFFDVGIFDLVIYEGTLEEYKKIQVLEDSAYVLAKAKVITAGDATTPPAAAPVVKSVVNVAGGVQVTWNKVKGAELYLVHRRGTGSNSAWVCLGYTDKTSIIDPTPTHNNYWRYSVQALNGAGITDFDYTGKYLKYVATPKLTGISNSNNGIYFKWNPVSGASGYRVYRRTTGGNWQYITTVKGTSYTDKAVKNQNGKYYRYTVRAVVGGRYSGYEDFLFTKRLVAPTLKTATNISKMGTIRVTWSPVKSTTGYYIYRKTANSGWKHVGTTYGTNKTTFEDFDAKKGVTYTYTVRAVYGKHTSYFNSGISCKKK